MIETLDLTRGLYRRLYGNWVDGRRINEVSEGAALLLIHLICSADDFGNLPGDPDQCRMKAAPRRKQWTTKRVAKMLDELAAGDRPLITFHEHQGDRYLHIVGWCEMQPAGKNGRRVRRWPASPDEEPAAGRGNPGESGGIQNNPLQSGLPHNNNKNNNKNQIISIITNTTSPGGAGGDAGDAGDGRTSLGIGQEWPRLTAEQILESEPAETRPKSLKALIDDSKLVKMLKVGPSEAMKLYRADPRLLLAGKFVSRVIDEAKQSKAARNPAGIAIARLRKAVTDPDDNAEVEAEYRAYLSRRATPTPSATLRAIPRDLLDAAIEEQSHGEASEGTPSHDERRKRRQTERESMIEFLKQEPAESFSTSTSRGDELFFAFTDLGGTANEWDAIAAAQGWQEPGSEAAA